MTEATLGAASALVRSLAGAAERALVARKLLLAPSAGQGRELLRRLSLAGAGWIGFEVTTPRPVALRLAAPRLRAERVALVDAFDEQALLDAAVDRALSGERGRLGELAEGVGFRERVHEAVRAIRLAGMGSGDLERVRLADPRKQRFLLQVLRTYERSLAEEHRADTATVLGLGAETLEADPDAMRWALDADVVLLLPGLGRRGLAGRLVDGLLARGAHVLEPDAVVGIEPPGSVLWRSGPAAPTSYVHAPERLPEGVERPRVELFRAASVNEELREVLRRVSARGLRWDQAEIVTPAPALYGSALHALAARMGVPVTYAVGLPIERTRTGRVARAYLDWIEEGFQAAPIRRLLEAGDLRPPRSGGARPPPAALARRFRSLRIGWGRRRYRTQLLGALDGVEHMRQRRGESAEWFERRRDAARAELGALRRVLFPTLKATPAVPDRMGVGGGPVSPSELARGLRTFLRRVPRGMGPDRAAYEQVGRVLERVEKTLLRQTDFRAAVTILRRHLELRVRAEVPGTDEAHPGAPWSSEGGALHLADLEHGGFTGREAVYLVGFDAERVPGGDGQDPVLLDADRRALGAALPTSTELVRERDFRLAALFARLRGTITMSYGAWDASEARAVGPSPTLLRVLRLARGDAALTFEDLRAELGRVVCAVPARAAAPLDADDVWMKALGGGDVMREGLGAVRASFARLDVGLRAREARLGTPSAAHGVVRPRPDLLDPRRNRSLVVSASRLEALGRCPLSYLHGVVLKIRPPDDPELDPERWLDPLRKGGLLHGVYEATLREARAAGLSLEDPEVEALGLRALSEGIERVRHEVPAPGEGVLRREIAALQEDVRSFVRMVRDHGAPWTALEWRFGLQDDEPVELALEGGRLLLRGAIDRVDEQADGLHVIDYKTGAPWRLSGTATFDGGRRLQHALYALAVEARLGRRVAAGEYHFPTRRGENQAFVFARLSLAGVEALLSHMLDGVAEGRFVPTDEPDDCSYCDFAEICRVRRGDYGRVHAPLAAWAADHLNTGLSPAMAHLKRTRTFEE